MRKSAILIAGISLTAVTGIGAGVMALASLNQPGVPPTPGPTRTVTPEPVPPPTPPPAPSPAPDRGEGCAQFATLWDNTESWAEFADELEEVAPDITDLELASAFRVVIVASCGENPDTASIRAPVDALCADVPTPSPSSTTNHYEEYKEREKERCIRVGCRPDDYTHPPQPQPPLEWPG